MAGPLVAPQASAEHPLDGLGLGTVNTHGAALTDLMGSMPGQAEAMLAKQQAEGRTLAAHILNPPPIAPPQPTNAPSLVQGQMPGQAPQPQVVPQPDPMQPDPMQPGPAQQFNEAIQPNQPNQALQPGQVVLGQADYDFLVGLIGDQGAALQGYMGGQTAVQGPSGIPVNSVVIPGAPAAAPPGAVPLTVPKVEAKELTDAEFDKLTTDKTAFAKYLSDSNAEVAANVTEQITTNMLPHIYGQIEAANQKERVIDAFLQSNPDLAAQPQALEAAMQQAKADLPYATPDRLLYYAANKLRGAMGVNNAINQSVHDHRGPVPARRAPVMNSQGRPMRVSQLPAPGNPNPFMQMRNDWIQQNQNGSGDILRVLNLGQQHA